MQKNLLPGKVKTRLAKDIGDEEALKVYEWLLECTYNGIEEVNAQVHLYFSHFIESPNRTQLLEPKTYVQSGSDLGERMWNAFSSAFSKKAQKVVIVGSDCPDLTKEHINQAFEQLNENDVVFGPSMDGGYYLLGLRSPVHELFVGKSWSTDQVLNESLLDLQNLGLTHFLLDELNDIDTLQDLTEYLPIFNEFKSKIHASDDV